MNRLLAQLARIEQQLYTQEHHATTRIGHLDDRYIERQARRRELTLAYWRSLEREIEALRRQVAERGEAAVVIDETKGFDYGQ